MLWDLGDGCGQGTLCSRDHSAVLDKGLSKEGNVIREWAAKEMAWGWICLRRLLLSWGRTQLSLTVIMGADGKPVMDGTIEATLEVAGELLQKERLCWIELRTTSWEFWCYIWGVKGVYMMDCFRHQGLVVGMEEMVEGLLLFQKVHCLKYAAEEKCY